MRDAAVHLNFTARVLKNMTCLTLGSTAGDGKRLRFKQADKEQINLIKHPSIALQLMDKFTTNRIMMYQQVASPASHSHCI